MPSKELTVKDRSNFALEKSFGALKWIVGSGVATFFLTGVLDIVAQLELPSWAVLLLYLVVNTSIYAIAKYREGSE